MDQGDKEEDHHHHNYLHNKIKKYWVRRQGRKPWLCLIFNTQFYKGTRKLRIFLKTPSTDHTKRLANGEKGRR
jgi:hypothetical protein